MLVWKSRGLTIAETWFDESLPAAGQADVVQYRQAPQPLAPAATDFYTLVTDLMLSEEVLFERIQKDSRDKIRRADEREGLTLEVWDRADPVFLEAFLTFYSGFATQRGLPPLWAGHLRLLQKEGRLDLARACTNDGTAIVYHANYTHRGRARLLHSASRFRDSDDSCFRNKVGRANRWLHWKGLQRLKASGHTCYDWGGWYEGTQDMARLSINRFKESFGGEMQRTYNGRLLLTTKAKVLDFAARLVGRR